ncbi:hypothetical protein TWF730_008121 [Orbilia blumenaviensis]|uniref:Uncharacterized protein n=1 Tax=Orbilia blumenaviensis TaxID=1796055 RepID=A0AAV9VBJ9_9PEZI
MGQIQSLRSHCFNEKYNVTKCTPTISPGAFETNPDIAGWGVLIAFAAGAFTTLILCMILVVIHFIRYFASSNSTPGAQIDRHGRHVYVEKDKWVRFADNVVQDLVLSLSDQQIVTGLALSIFTLFSQGGCDLSAYHYNIVANLILITICTHVCSIMVLPEYFRNVVLGALRILAIALIVGFSGFLFSNQKTVSALQVTFPTAVPPIPKPDTTTIDLAEIGLLVPAICYQVDNSLLRDNIKALVENPEFKDLGGSLAGIVKGRALNGYSQWILLTLLYVIAVILAIIQRIFRLDAGDSGWRRFLRKLIWLPRFLAIGIGCWAAVSSFIYVRRMRDWLNKSEWWTPDDDDKNPENDILGFGQLIPIFMLALLVVAGLESMQNRWNERKARKKEEMLKPIPIPIAQPQAYRVMA